MKKKTIEVEWDILAKNYIKTIFTLFNKKSFGEGITSIISTSDVILDAGCGPGLGIPFFAKRCGHLYAIDYSQVMVKMAKEVVRERKLVEKVDVIKLDIRNLSNFFTNKSIDIVYLLNVLLYKDTASEIIYQSSQSMKNDAVMVLNFWPPWNPSTYDNFVSYQFDRLKRSIPIIIKIKKAQFENNYETLEKNLEKLPFMLLGYVRDRKQNHYMTCYRKMLKKELLENDKLLLPYVFSQRQYQFTINEIDKFLCDCGLTQRIYYDTRNIQDWQEGARGKFGCDDQMYLCVAGKETVPKVKIKHIDHCLKSYLPNLVEVIDKYHTP